MANDLTGNPWKLDTGPFPLAVTTEKVRVKKVQWVGPTTQGHRLELRDSSGRVVWEAIADAANTFTAEALVETSGPDDWQGLTVGVLNSGKIYITHY